MTLIQCIKKLKAHYGGRVLLQQGVPQRSEKRTLYRKRGYEMELLRTQILHYMKRKEKEGAADVLHFEDETPSSKRESGNDIMHFRHKRDQRMKKRYRDS